MRIRPLKAVVASAAVLSVLIILRPTEVTVANEASAPSVKAQAAAPAPKTPWGEPDLEGI